MGHRARMALLTPEEVFQTLVRYPPARAAVLAVWARTPLRLRAALLDHMPVARFRVGVLGLLVDAEGRALLLEHRFRARHAWGLPGGWLDAAEDPAVGLARELREELDLQVAPEELELLEAIAPYETSRLELFFRVRREPACVPPNIEFLRAGRFGAHELPAEMFAPHRALVLRHMGAQSGPEGPPARAAADGIASPTDAAD